MNEDKFFVVFYTIIIMILVGALNGFVLFFYMNNWTIDSCLLIIFNVIVAGMAARQIAILYNENEKLKNKIDNG